MPCNFNQRVLAKHVKDGIRAVAARRSVFIDDLGPPTASRWAPRGCAPPRSQREVIADSIEPSSPRATSSTWPRLPGRLRQDDPRRRHGARAVGRPGPQVFYNGTIAPEAIRRPRRDDPGRKSRPSEPVRRVICDDRRGGSCAPRVGRPPRAGACGGSSSLPTRWRSWIDFLGISPRGLSMGSRRRTRRRPRRPARRASS